MANSPCVFQILGSLSEYTRPVFRIGEEFVEAYFASDALCRLRGIGCRIVLLVPESLATEVASDASEASGLVENWETLALKIVENVEGFFDPSNTGLEAVIIPSLGLYHGKGFDIVFRGVDHGDIEIGVFKAILSKILNGGCTEVLLDTSTGHNLYVASAVKAIRSSSIAWKLAHLDSILLGEENEGPSFKLVFTPPIRRGSKGPYEIVVEDIDARLFFSFPLSIDEVEKLKPTSLVRSEGMDKRRLASWACERSRLVKKVKSLVRKGLFLHNTIRYNTPLALYHAENILGELPSPEEPYRLMWDLLHVVGLDAWRKPRIEEDNTIIIVTHRGLHRRMTLYTVLALLETSALLRLHSWIANSTKEGMIEINTLRTIFAEKIYTSSIGSKDLLLNKRMLERDLGEVEKTSEKLSNNECRLLKDLLASYVEEKGRYSRAVGQKQDTDKRLEHGTSDMARNFFAHSGFLKEATIVCRSGERILVGYKLNGFRDHIRRWVEKPV